MKREKGNPEVESNAAVQMKPQNIALAERLKNLRKRMKLSQTEIAERIGVANRTWQAYEAGKTAPGAAALEGLHKMGVNLGWVVANQGPMVRVWEMTGGTILPDSQEDLVRIPHYEVRPAAGGGAYAIDEEPIGYLALSSEWIHVVLGCNPDNLLLVEAGGDSMYPTIADRDPLLVDRSQQDFRQDAIYVFRVDDAIQVKRIQKQTSGQIVLISDNPKYPSEVLSKSDAERLHRIGRVVWYGHKL